MIEYIEKPTITGKRFCRTYCNVVLYGIAQVDVKTKKTQYVCGVSASFCIIIGSVNVGRVFARR